MIQKQIQEMLDHQSIIRTSDVVKKLKEGLVPKVYQLHHEFPLNDSGTNDFSILVLIKNELYHKVITNYQNSIARTMKIGDSKEVLWSIIGKNIYN